MEKENTGKVGALEGQAIQAWVNELLHQHNVQESPTLRLTEWICAGLLWVRMVPEGFQVFCQEQLQREAKTPPQPSDLVLAGLSAQLSGDHLSTLEQLSAHHLQLAEILDPDDTGLLHWPSISHQLLPALQSAWIWSADQLLKWKLPPAQTEQLIQLKEVYVYETDRQLWEKNKKNYQEQPAPATPHVPTPANNALAMLAWIPDQDRAEDLLNLYRKHAPPWQSKDTAHPEWLGAAAYLLYVAFNAYEMTQAAEELKNYVLRHLPDTTENAKQASLLWLWSNLG
jgi:hypothetical protein